MFKLNPKIQYKFSDFYFTQFSHLFSPVARALYIFTSLATGTRQATAAIPRECPGETDTSH